MYLSLEDMLATSAEGVRPAERLTVAEAAEKYRYINNPGSYIGHWNRSFAPYLVDVLNALESKDHEAVAFVGPARCGKSDGALNWLTHSVECDPADMMVVQMTQSSARDWSQRDLRKALRHTPSLRDRSVKGKNEAIYDKQFTNGMALLIRWPSINELSSKTLRRVWLMDYDRMDDDIEGEGSAFGLALKRTETYGRYGMAAVESSPGRPITTSDWIPESPHEAPPVSGGILPIYNTGDRRRYFWRCVYCECAFEPDFKCLTWPDSRDFLEAAEQATLVCPHCAEHYHFKPDGSHGHGPSRNEMNQLFRDGGHAAWVPEGVTWKPTGEFVGTPRRSKVASFWLKGPCAVFATWTNLVYKYLSAKAEFERTGDEQPLKTTVTVDQGNAFRPSTVDNDRVPETLKDRAEALGDRVVPAAGRFLVATIDVQKARFVIQVHAIGEGGDIYIIDRLDLFKSDRLDDDGERYRVNPGAYLEDWKLLVDTVLTKTYPLADGSGRRMKIKDVFCDSGGREGVTARAYDFVRWLRNECETPALSGRFHLVKGQALRTSPRVALTYPDSQRKDRHAGARGEIPVLRLNSNALKDQLDHLLDRVDPGSMMIHFPDWFPDKLYAELTVEVRNAKGDWENPARKRNETWDLLYYCLGGLIWANIGIEVMDWQDPPSWADEWDRNDLIYDPSSEHKPFEAEDDDGFDFAAIAKGIA